MEIGLALGGGGARGVAHIGILRALEKEGIKIGAIAGTSIGGLVGAVYLSGWSPDGMQDKFSSIEQPKLYGHLKGEEPSLLGLAGGTKILQEMIGDSTFSDLRIPFAVTAVDINACQTLEIRSGRVLDAVLATIAVPGILPARRWGDRLLVDGGVANPVPVDLVRKLRPELPVLAVVLTEKNSAAPNLTVPIPEFPGAAPVVDYISRLRFAQALNVFVKSIDVGGKFLADIRLELDKPDLIIRPDVGEIGLLDNIDIVQVVKLGEDAAYTNLDKINKISSLGYRIQKIWSRR